MNIDETNYGEDFSSQNPFSKFYDDSQKENEIEQRNLYIGNIFTKYGPRMCYDDNFYRENFYTKNNLPMNKIEKNIYRFKIHNLNWLCQ